MSGDPRILHFLFVPDSGASEGWWDGGADIGAWQEAEMNKGRSCTKDTSLVGEIALAHHSPKYRFTAWCWMKGMRRLPGQSMIDKTGRKVTGQWGSLHSPSQLAGPWDALLSMVSETESQRSSLPSGAYQAAWEPLSQRVPMPGRQ